MRLPAPGERHRAALSPVLVMAALLVGCAAPGNAGPAPGIGRSGVIDAGPGLRSSLAGSPAGPSPAAISSISPAAPTATAEPVSPTAPASVPTSRVFTSAAGPSPTSVPVFGTAAAPIQVQVTGVVLADNRDTVVMCPPFAVAGVGTTSSETPTPGCAQSIRVAGVDLQKVARPDHNSTHRWGEIHIVAAWNGRSLMVRSQRLPTDADRDPTERLPDGVPCPAPTGGWKVGGVQGDQGIDKIQAAVGAGFGGLAMGYPHGGPTNADGTNPSYSLDHTEQVVVVGVTGDIALATAAIRKVFKDNLCVVRSATAATDIAHQNERISAALGEHMADEGVMSFGGRQNPLGTGVNQIDVVVDTPELHRMLDGIDGPPIVINAWIKPVR